MVDERMITTSHAFCVPVTLTTTSRPKDIWLLVQSAVSYHIMNQACTHLKFPLISVHPDEGWTNAALIGQHIVMMLHTNSRFMIRTDICRGCQLWGTVPPSSTSCSISNYCRALIRVESFMYLIHGNSTGPLMITENQAAFLFSAEQGSTLFVNANSCFPQHTHVFSDPRL